ncbi:MAG: DUF3341 domain-containing protein [Rhodomicrobium sp.]
MKRLIAAFESPEALMSGAEKLKAEGCPAEDALTPFQVHGLEKALVVKRPPIRRAMAIAGFSVAAFAYFLEWFSSASAYPINSGGRPFFSWQVFMLVPFEAGVLAAGIAGFITFLYTCGLPSLYHPVFDARGVERATCDRFFLVVNPTTDEGVERRVREALDSEGAIFIEEMKE